MAEGGRVAELAAEAEKTGEVALTAASTALELTVANDAGLTELCQVQWGLLREQIANISRELGALRQDINTLRFADSQSELQQNELSRHMREMQASFRRDLAAEGTQRQQLAGRFEASVKEVMELELSKLSGSMDAQRGESAAIEQRVQGSILELERLLQEAKKEFLARAGNTEEALSKRTVGDSDAYNELRRLVAETDAKHSDRAGQEDALRKELQALSEAIENQEKLHSSSMNSLQNTVRAQQQKAIDASIEPLRLSFTEHASNSKNDLALLADAHKKLQALHSVAETERSSDGSKTAAALEELEKSLLEKLEGRLSTHVDDTSKGHAELRELLDSVSSREQAARDSHRSDIQSSLEDLASSLKSEVAAYGSGLETHRGQVQESFASSGDIFSKRLEDLEAKLADQIDDLANRHGERHTDFEQRFSLSKTELQRHRSQAQEAHDTHAETVQGALDILADSLRKDLESHRDSHLVKLEDLHGRLASDKQDRDYAHSELGERIRDSERTMQDALQQLVSDHKEHRNNVASNVETLEQLIDRLSGQHEEHRSRHGEIKGQILQMAQEHGNKFGELQVKHVQHAEQFKAAHQEHAAATSTALEELEERLRGHMDSHRSTTDAAHQSTRETCEELDRKLKESMSQWELKHSQIDEMHRKQKDSLSQLSLDNETKHSAFRSTLSALEQKLRDELAASAAEHHSRHADVREHLARHVSDQFAKHSELKDHATKLTMSLQDRLREEHQGALQALEAKLRRDLAEHKAGSEAHQTSVREMITKNLQDRESLHGGIAQRIDEVDRRVKDAISRLVEEHEAKHTQIHSTLGGLERRLREELDQVQGAAQSDRHSHQAQLRDQVARASSELRAELQDVVTKVTVQDKSTRDEYRNSLMMAVEALEARLRREIANHKAGQDENMENMAQERKTLERSFALITDRLAELESRLSAEFSQAAITRDASGNELREIIAAAIEREREQADQRSNAMNLQISTLRDQVQRQLEQERAGREVHQESLRVYLTQDRAAREDAQRILQERMEKAESTFSTQMGDQASIMVPRQEFEQAVVRRQEFEQALNVTRQDIEQALKSVWEIAESLSNKVTTMEKDMTAAIELASKPAPPIIVHAPAPEPPIIVQAPPPSPMPAVEVSAPPPSPAPPSPAPAPEPEPASGIASQRVSTVSASARPVSPMRQVIRQSFSPITRVASTSTIATGLAGSVGPSRVASTALPMERARPLTNSNAASIEAEALPMASVTVTGVDRNRDGIPDILQGYSQATAPAAQTTPMATVDVKLGDKADLYVTGIDRNGDGIPDVLQQGQTVITSGVAPVIQSYSPTPTRSYSPTPTVRPARVLPPVAPGSIRSEVIETIVPSTTSGGNSVATVSTRSDNFMRITTGNDNAVEYVMVAAENVEEMDDYVCGPAQFKGKPGSVAASVASTPPRVLRQIP